MRCSPIETNFRIPLANLIIFRFQYNASIVDLRYPKHGHRLGYAQRLACGGVHDTHIIGLNLAVIYNCYPKYVSKVSAELFKPCYQF